MDHVYLNESRARRQRRQTARAVADAAEADLAMRLLIAALILVLCAVVAASTLVQLGTFRSAETADPVACVRLAGDDPDRCATRTEVADRLLARHLAD